MIQNSIWWGTFWSLSQLTWVKFIRAFGSNLATGDYDFYTVPAGKRACILGWVRAYNWSAGTIGFYLQIKVSASYYKVWADQSLSTLTAGTTWLVSPMCIEAWESFSINTSTTSWLNIWVPIIEFDATSALYTPRILALANWDNTLYTVPAWKSACISNINAVNNILIWICNDSWSTRSYTIYNVPSWWSPWATNIVVPATNASDNTAATYAVGSYLATWDFIVVNSNSGTAWQVAWVNIFEV